jgi:acetoin utilization protein AcuB
MWLEPFPVEALMQRDVVTVRAETLVSETAELMKRRRIRHVPVVNGAGHLVGIVTDRDLRQVIFDPAIRERAGTLAGALAGLTVREIMTWGVISVQPEADLRQAARLMYERKIGALPVAEGGRVVGIVTETDLLRALEDALRQRVTRVTPLRRAPAPEELDDAGAGPPGAEHGGEEA